MIPTSEELVALIWSQLWQVTVLIVAVALLARLFFRNKPHMAYLLWMLVVVKCITPPLWSSPTGLFSWIQAEQIAQRLKSYARVIRQLEKSNQKTQEDQA